MKSTKPSLHLATLVSKANSGEASSLSLQLTRNRPRPADALPDDVSSSNVTLSHGTSPGWCPHSLTIHPFSAGVLKFTAKSTKAKGNFLVINVAQMSQEGESSSQAWRWQWRWRIHGPAVFLPEIVGRFYMRNGLGWRRLKLFFLHRLMIRMSSERLKITFHALILILPSATFPLWVIPGRRRLLRLWRHILRRLMDISRFQFGLLPFRLWIILFSKKVNFLCRSQI